MKRFVVLLAAQALVCVLALSLAWWGVSAVADRQARKMLAHSREFFVQLIEDSLDGVIWYAASLGAYSLDYSMDPKSVGEMRRLAHVLYVDELSVVGADGVVVSSNDKSLIGYSFLVSPETRAYMKLVDPLGKEQKIIEPFRTSASNKGHYRKYGGVSFTNRLGFVQVGYSMERLVRTIAMTDVGAFSHRKFGRYGSFGGIDRDGDRIPDGVDSDSSFNSAGDRLERLDSPDGSRLRLTFPFAGRLFYAEIPDREFGDQRNIAFLIAAALIIALVALFTFVLIRLRLSADKVERLHREADARAAADLALAHTIQFSTLPQATAFHPECLAYALDAVMEPAREVGGDFYDFFLLADGRVALVVGDVSGKGVPAAMFMLMAKNAIRQALYGQGDPAVAMATANETLCSNNEAEMFVTMLLFVLDPATGIVNYVNAGHNRPFVVRSEGKVERLEIRGGRFLGLFPSLSYRAARFALRRGDRLFLYTDGVTEAMDEENRPYGEARLRSVLASCPESLCRAVRGDVARHVGAAPTSDDLTILTMKWRGPAETLSRTFPAEVASIAPALSFVRESCPLAHLGEFARLLQVVDEIVANIVNYSGSPTFTLQVETSVDRCKVVALDAGFEYNPLTCPEPDIHAPLEARQPGGLGILLVRRFSDFISWRREEGQNRLTVVKILKPDASPRG